MMIKRLCFILLFLWLTIPLSVSASTTVYYSVGFSTMPYFGGGLATGASYYHVSKYGVPIRASLGAGYPIYRPRPALGTGQSSFGLNRMYQMMRLSEQKRQQWINAKQTKTIKNQPQQPETALKTPTIIIDNSAEIK